MPNRSLIISDSFPERYGLQQLLRDCCPAMPLIELCSDNASALQLAKQRQYRLIIISCHHSHLECLTSTSAIKSLQKKAKIIITSPIPDDIFKCRCLTAGADDYIQSFSPEPVFIQHLLQRSTEPKSNCQCPQKNTKQDPHKSAYKHPFHRLSTQEFAILLGLIEGKELKEAAYILNLSCSAASTYKSRLFKKLKVATLKELYELAVAYQICV